MKTSWFIALRVTLFTLLLTGLAYPLLITGVSQVIFSEKANGSLMKDARGSRIVGSELIGQRFIEPWYFHGRPSASDYAGPSGARNYGPTSLKLREAAQQEIALLLKDNPEFTGKIPVELVTASASGLDPDITPEAALVQVARIKRARNCDTERIQQLIEKQTEGRDLGLFGTPRVNVMKLNLALDQTVCPYRK